MSKDVFRRNPDGWFLGAPYGEHPISMTGANGEEEVHYQIVDEKGVAAMVANIKKAQAEGDGGKLDAIAAPARKRTPE